MIEPSFPPSLRATPAGFRCGHSSHPRVARTLVSLTCAPPWASIGLCLRHGRSLGAFTNETPAQPAECSTLNHNRGNVAFPRSHAPTRERLHVDASCAAAVIHLPSKRVSLLAASENHWPLPLLITKLKSHSRRPFPTQHRMLRRAFQIPPAVWTCRAMSRAIRLRCPALQRTSSPPGTVSG
jgi:hypothetical protein